MHETHCCHTVTLRARLRDVVTIAVLLLGCLVVPLRDATAGYASLVIDADGGQVLHARNADTQNYPASLTKIMTLYLVFDALKEGRLSEDDRLYVSPHAASMPPSKLGLRHGQTIAVKDAILALVTKSANDVAVVIAEALGDTESEFAVLMTRKAWALGMSSTRFRNASGLPDRRQVSTARDMARLATALMDNHPEYYRLFATKSFTYKGHSYRNHNRLLGSYEGTDGIKTGYIRASGYNLVASAVRNGRRLVAVVFGGKSAGSRNRHMVKLLDKGFATPSPVRMAKAPRKVPPVPAAKPLIQVASATTVGAYRFLPYVEAGKPEPAPEAQAEATAPEPAPVAQGDASAAAIIPPVMPEPKPVVQAAAEPQSSGTLNKPWGVQVGAYYGYVRAEQAATAAAQRVPEILDGARIWVPQSRGSRGKIFQARLMGLTEKEAQRACSRLKNAQVDCMVLKLPKGISTAFLGPRVELAQAN